MLGLLKKVQNARSKSADGHSNGNNKNADSDMILDRENDTNGINTLKQCQGRKFPPLKLIIMSASLDARGFSEYFGCAKAVHVQGRQFPVEILYTLYPEPDFLDATLITIFQVIILLLSSCDSVSLPSVFKLFLLVELKFVYLRIYLICLELLRY